MSARILIAEDHPASLELMRYLLEASGYSVLKATDGVAALAVLRSELPDMVICDLQMPNVDGYEVLRKMKESTELCQIPAPGETRTAKTPSPDRRCGRRRRHGQVLKKFHVPSREPAHRLSPLAL